MAGLSTAGGCDDWYGIGVGPGLLEEAAIGYDEAVDGIELG